jgi:hypothetical protein
VSILLSILLSLLSNLPQTEPELTRVGPGVNNHFGIDMIVPNPMSDPHRTWTRFTWPDTLDLSLSITNSDGDTLLTRTYPRLVPGLYRFSWNYGKLARAVSAELNMNATDKRKELRFTFRLSFAMI